VVSKISSEDDVNSISDIPQGWEWIKLSDICKITDKNHNTPKYLENGVPMVSPKNFIENGIDWSSVKFVGKDEFDYFNRKCEPHFGDLLYSRIGTIGEARLVDFNHDFVALHSIAMVHPLNGEIDSKFILYLLKTPLVKHQALANVRSIGTPDLGLKEINEFSVPLPPIHEQHRIITKIEELLTQLDAGVASLKKAQAQLKRYRQAVLKAAFEGRLTKEWRKEHKGQIEPVDLLIERINQARKKTTFNKNDETHSAITDVQSLPDSWRWIRLDNIAFIKGGITKDSKRIVENGHLVPYLRVANVQNGYLDLNEMKTIIADEGEIKNLSLKFGDILFTEGGDRDKLGRGWIWQDEIPDCIYQNHIFRARFYLGEISSKYVSWFGNTHSQKYFMKKGKQTTNLASISLTQLRAFPVALAPIEEQTVIVNDIERYFSQIDHIENTITISLRQAESLRQSILIYAFEGKLVSQDPTDEPASVLLERIKAEKAKTNTMIKKRNTAKSVKTRDNS
jgi:type I restriction enzyme S subunit